MIDKAHTKLFLLPVPMGFKEMHQTRVKLNRVFFPRRLCQARSLGCGFAPM